MFFVLSAGVATISLLLLSRGLVVLHFLAALMISLRRSVFFFLYACYYHIHVSYVMALIGRGEEIKKKKKKEEKRENLAFL